MATRRTMEENLRVGRLVTILLLSLAAGPGRAEPADPATKLAALYETHAIVTGTGEKNRRIGFRQCLRDALVKVSGDQRILDEKAVAPLLANAGRFVAAFRYHDRLEGVPIHDEQGTHDRPHDLYCTFDPRVLDPLLATLGRRPWTTPRPLLVIFLSARNATKAFVLAKDGTDGFYMRDSFNAAAATLGIPILFPDRTVLRGSNVDAGSLPRTPLAVFDALAREAGGDRALAGSIVWSDRDLGWIAEWRLDDAGGEAIWQIRGVSFDEAFRDAMRGAAQILSGNGRPR